MDTYAWPVTLTGATWTCTPTGGASCPASGTGDIFTAVDLPAGSSMVFSMTGTVDPGASGWLITTGYVAPITGVIDPTPENAFWTLPMVGQILFYTLAQLGNLMNRQHQTPPKPVGMAYYLCVLNVASALAFWQFLQGKNQVTCTPRT